MTFLFRFKQFTLLLVALLLPLPGTAAVWPLPPGTEVVGELISDRLRHDDTLLDMARMHNIGQLEMRAANPGLDPWLPKPGATVRVPQLHVLPEAERDGIVINLSERRLYYFSPDWPDRDGPVVSTHPVGVGLLDRATPVTRTRVTARLDQPAWYPTAEVRAWYRDEKNEILASMIPPGPDNPLGEHAMILDADGLMIHGTHRPAGVGMRVSQGCIRLYPESIAALIRQIPVGTPVQIVDQPIRLGWRSGVLYLEVDPAEGDEVERFLPGQWPRHPEAMWEELRQRVLVRVNGTPAQPDWARARAAFERADGVPVEIAEASAESR